MKMENEKTTELKQEKSVKSELLNKIEAQRIEIEMLTAELKLAKDNAVKADIKITEFDKFATAGFFVIDPDGLIHEMNPGGAMMLGTDRSALIKSKFEQMVAEDEQHLLKNFLNRAFKSKSKEICELKLIISQDKSIFIHLEGIVPVNENRCFATAVDITGRKLAEDILIENELRLSRAMEATSDGLYDMDVAANTAICNSRYYSMVGYELYELPPTTDTWLSLMHPDDLERAFAGLSEQITKKNEFLEQEYRQKHKNGSWVWILDRSRIMEYDEYGNPVKIVGTHIDITERKNAEDKIQRLLRQKEIILLEVNHRIKNNMLSMQFLLRTQSNRHENPVVKSALLDASNRLQSMAVLYDKLYLSKNIIEASTAEFLPSLIDKIVTVLPARESLKIKTEIEDIVLHERILSPLGMILNELVTNSIKHAFEGCDDCLIIIAVAKKGDLVSMIYEDNGAGIPGHVNFENSTGFGMQLVGMLAEQIDASINIERGNGVKFILEFQA